MEVAFLLKIQKCLSYRRIENVPKVKWSSEDFSVYSNFGQFSNKECSVIEKIHTRRTLISRKTRSGHPLAIAVNPLSVISWHPHKFNLCRGQFSAIADNPASDTLKKRTWRFTIQNKEGNTDWNTKLNKTHHIINSIYLSQNWSVNSLSDLQFSAIDINALSPTCIPNANYEYKQKKSFKVPNWTQANIDCSGNAAIHLHAC
jgi:hypothetical protein